MEPVLPNPKPVQNSTPLGDEIEGDIVSSSQGVEVGTNKTSDAPKGSALPPAAQSAKSGASAQATPQPTAQQDDVNATTIPATDDSPAIAEDVDVIEKEWVTKARKIVNATKTNPREQENEVSKLQADYLMKRYGKQIKTSS